MSEHLHWYAPPCRPGDLRGEGALSLLGKPDLPLATVLMRETAQNSWDARLPGEVVRYRVHARTLTADQVEILRNVVFAEGGDGTHLDRCLRSNRVTALEISDRGTRGLGGPVRNDRPPKAGEPTDYADFVLNVGAQAPRDMAGGTYGFGKTITYLVSRASTIVIWTRCQRGRGLEYRLVASAFGRSFERRRRLHTGRQWWGQADPEGEGIAPVAGERARILGSQLFARRFGKSETGTSILILAPSFGDGAGGISELGDIAHQCAEAALWHLWPKMIPPPGKPDAPMEIEVMLEGGRIDVGDPSRHPVLAGFVESLQAVRAKQDGRDWPVGPLTSVHAIEMKRPVTRLGQLAITRWAAGVGARDGDAGEDMEGEADRVAIRPFGDPVRHVALLRYGPELVVKYLELPADPGGFHAGGVFRCAREHDAKFAASEPPAHDDWNPKSIADKEKRTHVNVALRRIRDKWKEMLTHGVIQPEAGSGQPAGKLGLLLAGLVAGMEGGGAGPDPGPRPSGGGGGRRGRSGARVAVSEPFVEWVHAGRTRALVQFTLGDSEAPVEVELHAAAGFEGGRDTDLIDDTAVLGFLPGHVLSSDGAPLSERKLRLGADASREWTAVVEFPSDLALDLDVRVRSVEVAEADG